MRRCVLKGHKKRETRHVPKVIEENGFLVHPPNPGQEDGQKTDQGRPIKKEEREKREEERRNKRVHL